MALPKSFFMFCFGDDFATKLRLPEAFVEKHGLNHRRRLSLGLKADPPPATSWDVKVKKIDDDFYIAGHGWSKFVNDNGPLEAKLLVFHILANSTALCVSIFGHDSCLEKTNHPSFHKILMDIPPKIPPGFMDKYGECIFAREMKLRNAMGATWEVEFKRVVEEDDGYYAFTAGWAEFCRDMGLEIFDLLLFSHAGDATYDVSVYAPTALEKDQRVRPFENPRWRFTLKIHHYSKIHVPVRFAEEAGLVWKSKIRLEYSSGGPSAEVNLNMIKNRVAFGSGWSKFWKGNKLTVDKPYTFEFVPLENVIRVWPHD